MITNKDIRVENGSLIINGDPYPLDGQSPETIMQIVEDNSDTTPTENSDAPITSGGVYTALGAKQDTLTFDTTPTDESTNPVTSGGIYTEINKIRIKTIAPLPVTVSFSNGEATIALTDINPNAWEIISVYAWGSANALSFALSNWTRKEFKIFNLSNPTFTGNIDVIVVYHI